MSTREQLAIKDLEQKLQDHKAAIINTSNGRTQQFAASYWSPPDEECAIGYSHTFIASSGKNDPIERILSALFPNLFKPYWHELRIKYRTDDCREKSHEENSSPDFEKSEGKENHPDLEQLEFRDLAKYDPKVVFNLLKRLYEERIMTLDKTG